MPVILCFGDSNTWGSDPASGNRYDPEVRWTGVLASGLGSDFHVIEEGLNGRTTNLDDVIEEDRNGRRYLLPCLESHAPFDLITIMLGTNDLKARFNRPASDIAQSAVALGHLARRMPAGPNRSKPEVLMIAPPPIVQPPDYDSMFAGGTEKSQRFDRYFRLFTERTDLHYLDAGSLIASSAIDGIHFDPAEHQKLGKAVSRKIESILSS